MNMPVIARDRVHCPLLNASCFDYEVFFFFILGNFETKTILVEQGNLYHLKAYLFRGHIFQLCSWHHGT